MKVKRLLFLVPALFLAGCTMTAEQCDPSSDPGFFNKIGCTVSGSYAERVDTKEQDLKALETENERLRALHASINSEIVLVEGSMAQRQAQLNQIEGQLSDLRSSLASKNQLSQELENKLSQIESQVSTMQNTQASASILEKQAQLEKLQTEYEELLTMSSY